MKVLEDAQYSSQIKFKIFFLCVLTFAGSRVLLFYFLFLSRFQKYFFGNVALRHGFSHDFTRHFSDRVYSWSGTDRTASYQTGQKVHSCKVKKYTSKPKQWLNLLPKL